jgi:DNA invertase Pin-like site-specific DNA recombinase
MAALHEFSSQRPRGPKYVAPTLPRIAALYCRVSTGQQAVEGKASLPTQLAALKSKAAEMGYAVDERFIYTDAHSGEELFERPHLARLFADAKARQFGLVLAYNSYALVKNTAHLAILTHEWKYAGIKLAFATEEVDDTAAGRIMRELHTFATEMDGDRRKDCMDRARRDKAERGKPAGASRANFGYRWAEVRRPDGRLSRERLEINPDTAPVMERLFARADAGQTLRSMAADLTRDGVPTPTGKSAGWDPSTVLLLLKNPLYCGRAVTLSRRSVPVDKSVRHHYARAFRAVWRPVDERIPLPESFAPPLVSEDVFERVQARLRENQRLASRNNRTPLATLARGLIRCGHCGYTIYVANKSAHTGPRYICQTGGSTMARRDRCDGRGIAIVAKKLDAALWATVCDVLTDPDRIAEEVRQMRATQAPGADLLATIDHQLDEVDQRIAKKRRLAEDVEDDEDRAELLAEIAKLRRTRRGLENERVGVEARAASWHAQERGLTEVVDWCRRVAGNLDRFTDAQRRATLLALQAEVRLYRVGHQPRAEVTLHFPVSGLRTMPLVDDPGTTVVLSDR